MLLINFVAGITKITTERDAVNEMTRCLDRPLTTGEKWTGEGGINYPDKSSPLAFSHLT